MALTMTHMTLDTRNIITVHTDMDRMEIHITVSVTLNAISYLFLKRMFMSLAGNDGHKSHWNSGNQGSHWDHHGGHGHDKKWSAHGGDDAGSISYY